MTKGDREGLVGAARPGNVMQAAGLPWWDASALCRCGKLCGVLLLTVHLLQSPGLSAAPLPAVTALRVKSSPFLLKMSCKYHHTGLVIPSATSPLGHCTLLHLNL